MATTKPAPPPPPPDPRPPLTVAEQMKAGPTFDRVPANAICLGCHELADWDRTTGLCVECWRVWRWSPVRERGGGC